MRPLTCQEVLDQLSEYLDAELRADRASEIEQHLVICENCRLEVYTIRRTILIYRCEEHVFVPDGIEHRLRQALSREYTGSSPNRDGDEGSA